MAKTDPYVLLGVVPESTTKEIRHAFRRLAFVVHPDRNQSPGANDAFMELHQAYRALMKAHAVNTVPVDHIIRGPVSTASAAGSPRSSPKAPAPSWQNIRFPLTKPLGSRLRGWVGRSGEWAVEYQWKGLRDMRYDVLVAWDEISGVEERPGSLDVLLTPGGAARLASVSTLDRAKTAYQFPLEEPSRLADLVRRQVSAAA